MTTRPESLSSASAAWMALTTAGMVSSGRFFADFYVDDDLGEDLEVGGQLFNGFAGAGDEVEDDEGGEEAVAGGGEMRQEDVTGLLAAEGGVLLEHFFEDVAVADGGAEHADAGALESGLKAHVGHDGGYDQVFSEQAAGFEVAGGDEEDGVAVDDVRICAG